MSVTVDPAGTVVLSGHCPVEEAETLLAALAARPGAAVDWSGCTRLHTAVMQVLLVARPRLLGTCGDPFVARWIAPRLAQQRTED